MSDVSYPFGPDFLLVLTQYSHFVWLLCWLLVVEFFGSKSTKKNIKIAYNGCHLTGLDSACEPK